jgi:hypothetical protein
VLEVGNHIRIPNNSQTTDFDSQAFFDEKTGSGIDFNLWNDCLILVY